MALNNKYSLVLASQSPRRKELLGWIDVPFEIHSSNVEEVSSSKEPVQVALDIARLKGENVWETMPSALKESNPLIVASDTLVELDGKIYGKPKTKEEARQMLSELSNRWHRVVTSVFLKARFDGVEKDHEFAVETKVKFAQIGEDIMAPYLESGESMDKAGAYGIQGKGLTFVEALEGSYSNVVGFPLHEFLINLKSFLGYSKDAENWREAFQC
jgi:septum formation protein